MKEFWKTAYYIFVLIVFIIGVILFGSTLCSCKGPSFEDNRPQKQKTVLKKNSKACKILRTFKTRNVNLHVSVNCFEKGTKNLHLTALFPINRTRYAARDMFWYLKEAFPRGTNIQAIQRVHAQKDGRAYMMVVYRLEHPRGVRLR